MPSRWTTLFYALLAMALPSLILLSACGEEPPKVGTITGTVYNAETTTIVDGVNLTTNPATESLTSGRNQQGEHPGGYEFSDIPLGKYTIKASMPGYIDKYVQVDLTQKTLVAANIHLLPDPGLEYPSDQLLLYYPFAGNTRDMSGNKNHGNDTTALPVYDRWEQAYNALGFDGQKDYIVSTRPISVGTEFSVLLWVFRERGMGEGTFMLEDHADACSQGYGLALGANGSLSILGAGCPDEVIPANVTIGADCWHLIALVVRGSYLYLYIDGFQAGYPVPAIPVSNFQLVLGAVHPTGQAVQASTFRGQIDDVQVYNSALPPDAIRALYGAYECVP
jgi:hypothetical protein